MIDLGSLITIGIAFFVAAASPGPATLGAATVAMRSGRRDGIRFALGLSAGLAFWGIIAATGVGAILEASAWALTLLKLVGGVYLLWLALRFAQSARRNSEVNTHFVTGSHWFTRGLLLNLSNPKAVIAWMATLSLGISNNHGILQVAVATLLCMILGALIYAAYALAFSMPGAMNGYARARRWIDGAVAGVFAIAGLGLLRSAFSR